MSNPAFSDTQLANGLSRQIDQLDALAKNAEHPLDREKFRKSAFRLRAMQAETDLYHLVGRRVSLAKFLGGADALRVLDTLEHHAKTASEHAQVSKLRHTCQRALAASAVPYLIFLFLFAATVYGFVHLSAHQG